MSWDLERIVADDVAMNHMEEMEEHHRKQFWAECGMDGRER
jgi:hypothetical protein